MSVFHFPNCIYCERRGYENVCNNSNMKTRLFFFSWKSFCVLPFKDCKYQIKKFERSINKGN